MTILIITIIMIHLYDRNNDNNIGTLKCSHKAPSFFVILIKYVGAVGLSRWDFVCNWGRGKLSLFFSACVMVEYCVARSIVGLWSDIMHRYIDRYRSDI